MPGHRISDFVGRSLLDGMRRLNARHPWSHNDHFHSWILANLPEPCRSVLDVGCGRGELLAALAPHVGRAVGADVDAAMRAQARAHFGFAEDALVLLVFGGSQGAASINRAVSAAAGDLAARRIAVLHAHGPKNALDLPVPSPGDPPYVPVPYLDRMDLAYAAADLAICRSGAMTVAEVSAVGLPAVYVPLPIGNGEQRLNALPVVEAGGGLLVDDADLGREFVADTVGALLTDGPRLAAMTDAAGQVGHRDAAQKVARVALDVARRNRRQEERR